MQDGEVGSEDTSLSSPGLWRAISKGHPREGLARLRDVLQGKEDLFGKDGQILSFVSILLASLVRHLHEEFFFLTV